MWRPSLVHVNPNGRILLHQHAGSAGVVEVDVRQQDAADVAQRHARLRQSSAEHRQRRGRAGVDDRHAVDAVQDAGGNDARRAEEFEIEI